MTEPTVRRTWSTGVAAVWATTLLLAEPVLATSCDERAIAAMSVDEAAKSVWKNADLIGFGYVTSRNTPEREQQFIDIVLPLKGAAERRYAFAPVRVGRVGWHGPGRFTLPARQDEMVFVALVRIDGGYAIPACQYQVMAKDRAAIVRWLVAKARSPR